MHGARGRSCVRLARTPCMSTMAPLPSRPRAYQPCIVLPEPLTKETASTGGSRGIGPGSDGTAAARKPPTQTQAATNRSDAPATTAMIVRVRIGFTSLRRRRRTGVDGGQRLVDR